MARNKPSSTRERTVMIGVKAIKATQWIAQVPSRLVKAIRGCVTGNTGAVDIATAVPACILGSCNTDEQSYQNLEDTKQAQDGAYKPSDIISSIIDKIENREKAPISAETSEPRVGAYAEDSRARTAEYRAPTEYRARINVRFPLPPVIVKRKAELVVVPSEEESPASFAIHTAVDNAEPSTTNTPDLSPFASFTSGCNRALSFTDSVLSRTPSFVCIQPSAELLRCSTAGTQAEAKTEEDCALQLAVSLSVAEPNAQAEPDQEPESSPVPAQEASTAPSSPALADVGPTHGPEPESHTVEAQAAAPVAAPQSDVPAGFSGFASTEAPAPCSTSAATPEQPCSSCTSVSEPVSSFAALMASLSQQAKRPATPVRCNKGALRVPSPQGTPRLFGARNSPHHTPKLGVWASHSGASVHQAQPAQASPATLTYQTQDSAPFKVSPVAQSILDAAQQRFPGFDMRLVTDNMKQTEHGDVWTLGHLLGSGTYGHVYKYTIDGSEVAVKVCKVEDDYTLNVFSRELRSHTSLQPTDTCHPNVLSCLSVGCDLAQKKGVIVTPLCARGDLWTIVQEHIAEGKPLQCADMYKWAKDIVRGLRYMHENGRAHGDLKEANILVDKHGTAKLADFGSSYMAGPCPPRTTPATTVIYASPLINSLYGPGDKTAVYTESEDIFSVGVVLQRMFTGHYCFNGVCYPGVPMGMSWDQLAQSIADGSMRHTCHPHLPEALKPVITAALATDADKRCSLADIECALDQAMQDMQAAEQRAAQLKAQRQAWAAFSAQAAGCQATGLALV